MIKAVIIDDESRAVKVLSKLLGKIEDEIEIVATASNVPDGVLAINRSKPDVVFLDIEMPDYSGFELLEFFNNLEFEIIFATAYSEYAIRAFEVSAVDYILKPIQIQKLQAAIDKLKKRISEKNMNQRLSTLKQNLTEEKIRRLAIPVSDGLLFVDISDISNLLAEGAYTTVWLKDGREILVSKSLKYFEDFLEEHDNFFRTHRSHIVNLNYLKKYSRHESSLTLTNENIVRISKNHKQAFEETVNKMKLG